MKRIAIVLFLATILITSCNKAKENDKAKKDNKESEKVEEQLEVRFSFKTNKEDVFRITMNNIQVDELQKKSIQIFETISPTPNYEEITASFDKGNMSEKIVVSLGNKKLKKVDIEKVTVTYKNKAMEIGTAEELFKFFRFNKYVVVDSTSKVVQTKRFEGQHNPSFSFTKRLINQLKKK